LEILEWLYSSFGRSTVLYSLIILGTALIVVYFVDLRLGKRGFIFFSVRRRPMWATGDYEYTTGDYGVEWHQFVPPFYAQHALPWADGPFCPECKRELEEEKTGLFSRKMRWFCPMCNTRFPMPKGEVKEMVEKNFAAYLRKKGKV
jgi:hypothetical protein